MKTIYLQQKKSGSYVATPYIRQEWVLVAECANPTELFNAVRSLGSGKEIIKKEYSRSQLKTKAVWYSIQDACKAFGLKYDKATVEQYSI